MATEIIRIGDTYKTTYTFYNPLADVSPPAPDLNSPIDLTGITISWHLKNRSTVHSFAAGAGVTVTPEEGLVEIEVPKASTAEWKIDEDAVTFLKFVYPDGDEDTKAQKRVRILKRESI